MKLSIVRSSSSGGRSLKLRLNIFKEIDYHKQLVQGDYISIERLPIESVDEILDERMKLVVFFCLTKKMKLVENETAISYIICLSFLVYLLLALSRTRDGSSSILISLS